MRKILIGITIAAALVFGSLNVAPTLANHQKEEKMKGEKSQKSKSEKSEKSEKSSKTDKAEKSSKSDKADKKSSKKKTLYSRLGGKKAITAVVDEFVNIVAADARINKFFQDTAKDPARLAKFKQHLVNQICQGTGGPCKYTGKDMKTAHTGMGITEADFNALVEDLVAALNKLNVAKAEQDELLAILGPMKGDIVGQ